MFQHGSSSSHGVFLGSCQALFTEPAYPKASDAGVLGLAHLSGQPDPSTLAASILPLPSGAGANGKTEKCSDRADNLV